MALDVYSSCTMLCELHDKCEGANADMEDSETLVHVTDSYITYVL